MAINYGPYPVELDAAGPVSIRIRAGLDPVVSANCALFAPNPNPPPPFVPVENPIWPEYKTTSNVLPLIDAELADDPATLDGRRLMVVIGFSVMAPNPSPNYQYTATIAFIQDGATKGKVPVRLTNDDLTKWHQFGIDFKTP